MTAACASSDAFLFLRAWVKNPLQVASVTPSGPALSRLITREIDRDCGSVMELGPGTGVFTRALLDRGVPQARLTLVERGENFATILATRFPEATVLAVDAARIGGCDFGDETFGAVVSGLPLLSMPPRKVMSILAGTFRHLRADGRFYQFTYGLRCPVPRAILTRLGLQAVLVGRTIRNVPPAAVYRISRCDPLATRLAGEPRS